MPKPAWDSILAEAIDPSRVRRYWDQLLATPAGPALRQASPAQVHMLSVLLSGSQTLSEQLIAHPEWLLGLLTDEYLSQPRPAQVLRRNVTQSLDSSLQSQDYSGALQQLRRFKRREMLRIAVRDLARLGNLAQLTAEISTVAEICLDAVLRIVSLQLTQRLGLPYHQRDDGTWLPTEFCVIGLGKLGGQELNYSSDVDLLFVYSSEGYVFGTPPAKNERGKGLSNHQFYQRLAKEFINEITRLSPDGMFYRIDMRLRPEGESGPLVRALDSYEIYYAQGGQIWERLMLIKARCIAGTRGLGAEFIEMIQPFRYPRSLHSRMLREVAAMKDRIEVEVVKTGELERNVKLGRGGIREIEFYVQSLQLLHAGKNPFLQGHQTLPALQHLVRYHLLKADAAQDLSEAYHFLRDVEHRLQMENDLQTHTIPTDRKSREHLALLMGCATLKEFEQRLQTHTGNVRRIYSGLLKADQTEVTVGLPRDFEHQEKEWRQLIRERSFRDTEKAFRLLQAFVHGPGYVHISPRTSELALELVQQFLACCPAQPAAHYHLPAPQKADRDPAPPTDSLPTTDTDRILSDPDRVLTRLDSFINAYGARATLYDLWTHNPSYFELLLRLFDRSEFLAEVAIRTPDLIDDLALSGRLRRSKTAENILKELRYGRDDEDQLLWLRRYHQAEQLRIGLRDILGLADFEQNLEELSALAEACLHYALEVVQHRHKLKTPPFAIIGLGKLGGAELNYGSDLDILFVATNQSEDLSKLHKWAVELMEMLSAPTDMGVAFKIDTRLRPDGEKGLLVNTLQAYDDYYRQRASLWEIQALSRTRPVAGDMRTGMQFQTLAGQWSDFSPAKPAANAWTPGWKGEIRKMRERITKERTQSGSEPLAIKTGTGGLMDAEFAAQILALNHGWQEPNTLKALLRAKDEKLLASKEAHLLIANYRNLRHIEGILRRWSFAGETVLPTDPEAFQRVSIRCGFKRPADFQKAVAQYRSGIQAVYQSLFSG